MKAKEIMNKDVITIRKDSTIEEIAKLLTDNKISGVPVVDEESHIIGMVTQKDLLYKDVEPRFPAFIQILGGYIYLDGVKEYNEELKKLVATTADQIMTHKVVTVGLDAEVEEIAKLMVEKNINRIPVVDEGKLAGIISRADIVKYLSSL